MTPIRRIVSSLAIAALLGALGCGGDDNGGSQTAPPVCSLSLAALDFGSVQVGQTKDLTFTITNTGQGTLSGTIVETCTDYSIVGNASYSLGPGIATTITVRFAPTASGNRTCALGLSGGCANVPVTGIGTPAPCAVAPATLGFGLVELGQSKDLTFTITNSGTTTLAGTVTSPCAEFTIQGNASYSLAPTASATITVRYTPASGGADACTIDTGNGVCLDVSVTGSSRELDSPSLAPTATYSHTFQVAGNYPYHCGIHPVMTGTVVVDPNSGVTSASVSIANASATGFQPQTVTIAPGGTVTWTNNDATNHTVTSD